VRSEPAAAKPPATPPAAIPETPRPSGPAPSTPSVADVPASPVAGPLAESPAPKPAAMTATPPVTADAVAPKPAQPATIEPTTAGTAAPSPKAVQPPAQVAAIPAAPEVASPAGPQGQPEGAAAKASRIVVRAKLDSWIQVRDGVARRLLVTRLLRAGDTYRVPDQPDLTLLTGNAGALEITVDGTVVPSIGSVGAVRRDVVLDADKLKAGTAVVN
jgi:cytoskeleton protein RodZ